MGDFDAKVIRAFITALFKKKKKDYGSSSRAAVNTVTITNTITLAFSPPLP